MVPLKVSHWWQMNYNFAGGWRALQMDCFRQPASRRYFSYILNFTKTFLLPKAYAAELSGWYSSTNYYGSIRNIPYLSVNMGFKKILPNNQGSLQLGIINPIRFMGMKSNIGATGTDVFKTKGRVMSYPESAQFLILRFSYTRSGAGKAPGIARNSAITEKNQVRT
ncbi:Outer membrane protein beta-barrel family protein [Chitinophaga costaii]|uniref:Outer membrane protein beta-barrel family protein n=1 Tax=Chitinophaga costaii TaxID=1335309 RepID=A0A1C4G002_9BACT|nr:outer membrane beta-barrel protein [Chitinophaga costaii]PUZ20950.1 hypothetical protein DCM91_17635 [Chitinophaga costaii]SCC61273.1 Outer membrane protein beta-barrel family protein [Chitinophaga costaii]